MREHRMWLGVPATIQGLRMLSEGVEVPPQSGLF